MLGIQGEPCRVPFAAWKCGTCMHSLCMPHKSWYNFHRFVSWKLILVASRIKTKNRYKGQWNCPGNEMPVLNATWQSMLDGSIMKKKKKREIFRLMLGFSFPFCLLKCSASKAWEKLIYLNQVPTYRLHLSRCVFTYTHICILVGTKITVMCFHNWPFPGHWRDFWFFSPWILSLLPLFWS